MIKLQKLRQYDIATKLGKYKNGTKQFGNDPYLMNNLFFNKVQS